MNNLHISKIDSIDFSHVNQNNENEQKDNIKDYFCLINEINDSINNNISQSVLELVNCFNCFSPANEPLTSPK